MGHYIPNLRDLEFNLFEMHQLGERLTRGRYGDLDEPTLREILAGVAHLAATDFADSFAEGDRTPPVFDPALHTVTLPSALHTSYRAVVESGFTSVDLPTELGGLGAPAAVRWAIAELLLGANPALYLYLSGYPWSSILWRIGNAEQQRIARIAIDRGWGATMVLTEPDAGSDVGAARTRAEQQADGTWHITGVKHFITSGEHDLTENILHFVLARPVGAGPGTKGLSLFIVPKFCFDTATGELGERNGVNATKVEHKMGIKGSATCELTFGADAPALGWLVADTHDGIHQMFELIEYARMLVATKAISTLSTGYLNALDYAKQRVQSADLQRAHDIHAPRVVIAQHPDVRRQLMLLKTYAEGLRALVQYAAHWQDEVAQAATGDTAIDAALADEMNDLLLPIVKGVGSERSYEMLAQALQVFGGSGYLQDYPLEQYLRDAKIDTLYEGTTAIQGLDLFFRKMVRNEFRAVRHLAAEITATVESRPADDELAAERKLLAKALTDVQAMITTLGFWAQSALGDPEQVYKVGLNSTRLLMACGDLIIGWLLLRQAEVAAVALAAAPKERDIPFYTGKVTAARWFAANRLPLLSAERYVCEHTDDGLMRMPVEAF